MKEQKGFVTSKKERMAYCLFFLGQNILWGYAGYVETFLTDVGIAAATAAVILLVPKLWDAVNDMLFGYLIDRTRFKNGQKFIPWIKIGLVRRLCGFRSSICHYDDSYDVFCERTS